jgi:membrane protease YdiL (CAAX protease family)
MSADSPEICEPAPQQQPVPDALARQMSRGVAVWGLLILVGAYAAYQGVAPAISRWWFAPACPDKFHQAAFYTSLLLFVALVLTLILAPLRDLRRMVYSKDDVTTQLTRAIIAAGCCFAFEAVAIIPYWFLFFARDEGVNEPAKILVAAAGTERYAGAVVLVMLIGAAAEELLFRGLLLRYLNGLLRVPWLAILISAAAFGAGHLVGGYFNALVAFWNALVLGTVYMRRGSLLTVTLAHFLYNLLNLELGRLFQPGG